MTGMFPGLLAQPRPGGAVSETLSLTPLRLPHALPLYRQGPSFLATGNNGKGDTLPASAPAVLENFAIVDDVVVPPEFERYLLIRWGDRPFADRDSYVGYNCDFTAFVADPSDSTGAGWLAVNHEYVSYPFSRLAPNFYRDLRYRLNAEGKIERDPAGRPRASNLRDSFDAVVGEAPDNPHPFSLPGVDELQGSGTPLAQLAHAPDRQRLLAGECKYNAGLSLLRLHRESDTGRFDVVDGHRDNRRIHGLSGLAINRTRQDGYQTVTQWGPAPHQQGNDDYLSASGPAADDVFPHSSDGLGARIIGTAYNCSGGVTPWGTVLSCEENMQTYKEYYDGVQEWVGRDGRQLGYISGTTGAVFGLVGEKYGWVVEVDPKNPNARAVKHTSLGRFRHENVALRVTAGAPLIAYMGDDRRGGHTWKWVSRGPVQDPADPSNSGLFAEGTLYVARFAADGTGRWIPLRADTAIAPNRPHAISSEQSSRQGQVDEAGLVLLPRRKGIAGAKRDGGPFELTRDNEATALDGNDGYLAYAAARTGTLADFYPHRGAILVDAFLAANLVGGTPTARPEDLEIIPTRPWEVLIAYTSAAAGGDGYPDSRIFTVAKYAAAPTATGPWGGLYKIIEDHEDGYSRDTFRWQRLAQSGEEGVGAGFANVDNLTFGPGGHIFATTDISTSRLNSIKAGAKVRFRRIDHSSTDTRAVRALTGVYGNNFMFYVPESGAAAGEIIPIAYGPVKSELTGPTFIDDTLILSVQHPGENAPIFGQEGHGERLQVEIELLDPTGTLVTQRRVIQQGSNWPSQLPGDRFADAAFRPPRPSVVAIRRKKKGPFLP